MKRRDFLRVTGMTAGGLFLGGRPDYLYSATPLGADHKGPFSFVLVSDTHYARAAHYDAESLTDYARKMSVHTDAMWDATWKEVKAQLSGEQRPSFVLHLGDYVHGDCPTPEKSLEHYASFVKDLMRQELPVPVMLARGNHELQGKGVREAYEAHMPQLLKQIAPASKGQAYYGFDVGPDARFLVLDVYQPRASAGLLGHEQFQWLADELAAFRKRSPKGLVVLATHYPIFPMTPRGAVFDKDPATHAELLALLVEYRVPLVLCGHLHQHSRLTYTDPRTRHVITQVMTYTICPAGEQKGHKPKLLDYRPEMIQDVTYRKPEHLESIRAIVDKLAPHVSDYQTASVPGYQIISVEGPRVRITAYRGLGQNIYETFEPPCG